MKPDIKQIWTDQESTAGKNVVRKRIESLPRLNCYIGLIGITGARMFQMEIDSLASANSNFQRKFQGLEIQIIPFGQSQFVYTIILIEKELTDVFTKFIEDIIDKLHAVTELQEALTLINQRVNYWKKLFSKATGELISAEKQRGLFGELIFLSTLLKNTTNPEKAILSWRGSISENQDFALNQNAVEIKTSKANNPTVHISNELQLDFNHWEHLFLGFMAVTETIGKQNTLASIIAEIKEIVKHDAELIREFESKLELVGLFDEMIEYYNVISYSVQKRLFFQVRDGFPVILKGDLYNKSIYNVKYQIDISSCTDYEVSEQSVIEVFI